MKKKSTVVVLGAAGLLLVGGGTGAVAGSMVTSAQIKNNTIRSVDVRDHSLGIRDLNWHTKRQIRKANRVAARAERQARIANRRITDLEQQQNEPIPLPVVSNPFNPVVGGVTHFQVELPPEDDYGMVAAAKKWDDPLEGVMFHTEGTCADNPTRNCVKVEVLDENTTSWTGRCYCYGTTVRVIELNKGFQLSTTPVHELGHALGLAHHDGIGVMAGTIATIRSIPSEAELEVLRQVY